MNNVILNLIEGVLSLLFLLGLILLVLRYVALPIIALILSPILFALNALFKIIMFVIIILKKIICFLGSLFTVKKQDNIRNEYYKESDYISWEEFIGDDSDDDNTDSAYSILGVSPDDSLDTIKQVYRSLSKVYHPDKNKSEVAELEMKKINIAWETIQKEKLNS
ncbi:MULTISPECIES: J domain-containing protein [Lactococcus]|uniref:J domain-containing protein n=1 Tax=Lactococcus TaxID=1357 RepID=UPI001BCD7BB0|nr:J domain-containing protein [Lactococcus petauri]MBS4463728.1 J domain-containing protein [Lactococcus garvieae]